MSTENIATVNWVEELCDRVADMLADAKRVKFNTHKNRKIFTNDLVGLIKAAITKNAPSSMENNRSSALVITRPNSNQVVGHSVMTEGASQRGDDVLANKSNRHMNAGMRVW